MTRASLVCGPFRGVRGSATWFTKDTARVALNAQTIDIVTSHGLIDKRWLETTAVLPFTPDGKLSSDLLSLFWNDYANMLRGTTVFGAADIPTVLHAADGAKHTVIASALTKIPDIILSPENTIIGSAEITGIIGNNLEFTDASSLYTIGTGATFADSGFTPAAIVTQTYTAAWGARTGWTAFQAKDQWNISFNLSLEPLKVQGVTRDFRFVSLEVMAKCVPIGPTPAQIKTALGFEGASAKPGRSFYSDTDSLTITGANGTAYVTIPKAALVGGGFAFGASELREDEIGFYACRNFSAGAQVALYTIAAP